jgi:magnesium chelatase family protein
MLPALMNAPPKPAILRQTPPGSQRSNPQPCGYFNDASRECKCSIEMIQRYVSKISGPLMDRIDIHIDVPAVNYKELRGNSTPEDSASIRERVLRAREVQLNRFAAAGERIYSNAQIGTAPDSHVL